MRVAYITNNIAPFRVELLDELDLLCDGVSLYYFNEIDIGVNPLYVSKRPQNAACICLKKKSLYSKIRTVFGNDIIVFDGYSGKDKILLLLACLLFRRSYYISIDGIIEKNVSSTWVKKTLKRLFLVNAKYVFSTNLSTDRILLNISPKIRIKRHIFTTLRKKDFEYIDNIDKSEVRNEYGVGQEKLVLFVGKYLRTKGIYEMLEAVNQNNRYIFVGGEFSSLDIDLKLIPKNVYSIPYLEKKDILALMKASDIFVLPTYTDVWGLVIIEALSVGLPVVTTDMCNAGLQMITEGKNGFIIPIKDSKALAKAIDMGLKLDIKDVSEYNKKHMNLYTLENSAKDMMETFVMK